ncbi:protein of unknown function [Cupriavidus taiwanensis]|nr:protein of unknown function [Cupriavidus taiwanensis]SOZ11554.1 protein of unknown function [Cupriavidus taiwanensis]SOZ42909.1 protein of unknown function [Cupriavidus taiwanensis]SPC22156.1 protein of unknown function [Cupriavidus taiwanensis]
MRRRGFGAEPVADVVDVSRRALSVPGIGARVKSNCIDFLFVDSAEPGPAGAAAACFVHRSRDDTCWRAFCK